MSSEGGSDDAANATGSRVTNWNKFGPDLKKSLSLGSSFKQSICLPSLMSYHTYKIVVGIDICNYTKYNLTDPRVNQLRGYMASSVLPVKEAERQALISHKSAFLSGSSGIASWLVGDKNLRVVVAWAVPLFFGSNRIGVGIAKTKEHKQEWFEKIMSEKHDPSLTFSVHSCGQEIRNISATDGSFVVNGSMGNSSRAEVTFEIQPAEIKNLSTKLIK